MRPAASAARDLQAVAGDEHARSGHQAGVDQIAHGDVVVVARAQIADRGHAGLERLLRVVLREVDGGRAAPGLSDLAHVQHVGHVSVDVDQAGDGCVFRHVDRLAGGRANALDVAVLDDDDGVREDFFAVPDVSETIGLGVQQRRDGEEQQDLFHATFLTYAAFWRPFRIFTNEAERSSSSVRPVRAGASASGIAPQFTARRK